MTDQLDVLIGGTSAGTLMRARDGRLSFEYLPSYGVGATPLSLSMPIQLREFGHASIHPWLRGLLPDNESVLARWGKQFQVSPSSPFALLGTPIGRDCAGAVQFRRSTGDSAVLSEVEWIDEAEIARRIRELQVDQSAWTTRSTTGQFSLAGAQAKMALRFDGERWGVPSGDEPTTHILKPAIVGLVDHDVNEHLCLAAAAALGLSAAPSAVHRFEDEAALVVERYDRVALDGRLVRVHQEDFCQAHGVQPEAKYQNEGGPSPKDIAALLRASMSVSAATQAVWAFAEGLIWNWLVGGTDAHAKNYSVLIAGPRVAFAPLYDIASALPYGDHERTLRLAMKVGGKYDVFPAYNTWRRAARELGLLADELEARVKELARVAPDAFSTVSAGVDDLGTDMPARLTDLIADRCARCLHMMETTKPL